MLKDLQTHHREIARMKFQGFTPQEIATRTGGKVAGVYAILRDPLCQSFIQGLDDKADQQVLSTRQRLHAMEDKALDRAGELLEPEAKIAAAPLITLIKDVLDRNGYKAPEKHEHTVAHLTFDDIRQLRERAEAADITPTMN